MDSGLSGTATCNVTVRDEAGMSDSGNDVTYYIPYPSLAPFVETD
jgi:hypothetical protein